ncbi:MAG: EamA family transporter [Candidatus Delongbacteria bacterium]
MSPLTGIAAALGAALLWVLATRLFQGAGSRLPALELNLCKGACALLLFSLTLPFTLPGTPRPDGAALGLLVLSGVLGIGLGDTAYFRALGVLGTRRVLLLELLAAPTAAGLSWLALQETLRPAAWLGLGLTLVGVGLAVWGGFRPEGARRLPPAALLWGLLAALCQGGGLVLARGAFHATGMDPALAAGLRLAAGEAALLLAWSFSSTGAGRRAWQALRTDRLWLRVAGAALLGTWLGIWLQQVSLARLPAGVAQTLLSTAPLFALLLARLSGRRTGALAWAGAALALAGIFLLSSGLGRA